MQQCMLLSKSCVSAQFNRSTAHSTSYVYHLEEINSLGFVCNFAFRTNFDKVWILDDYVIDWISYFTRVIIFLNMAS